MFIMGVLLRRLVLVFLVRFIRSKTFNETLTPWSESNCVVSTSVDFSPINVDTQKLTCDKFIFMDILFD
jgi:hypothetical protein